MSATRDPILRLAARHATKNVPVAAAGDRVADVRASLLRHKYDSLEDVVVLDGRRLLGMVPIETLFAADDDAAIASVMDAALPLVTPDEHERRVAWQAVERAECSIAVVDRDGHFAGVIPPHRMLEVLLTEHDRDLARLGGYLHGGSRARDAMEEDVSRRLAHRVPWLLVGLAGAMASAVLVGIFESELESNVLIAVFVPAVVYIADAVGTQTETLVIRGLSAGIDLRRVARLEAITGVAVGVIVAAAFFLFAIAVWGDSAVALAVALALLASCSIATIVAMTLPWLLERAGQDPAFGSGPLATVIQDLLSIAVYLVIAVALTGG